MEGELSPWSTFVGLPPSLLAHSLQLAEPDAQKRCMIYARLQKVDSVSRDRFTRALEFDPGAASVYAAHVRRELNEQEIAQAALNRAIRFTRLSRQERASSCGIWSGLACGVGGPQLVAAGVVNQVWCLTGVAGCATITGWSLFFGLGHLRNKIRQLAAELNK